MSKCPRCGTFSDMVFKEERIESGTVKTLQCMNIDCRFVWREFYIGNKK